MIDQEELSKAYATTRTVGLSVSSGIIFYGVIAYVLNQKEASPQTPETVFAMLRYIFFIGSVMSLLAIQWMRRVYLNRPDDADAESSEENRFASDVKKLQSLSMMTFGLCEIPAMLGFVLSVLTHRMNDFYPFLAISWLGFVFYFPKYDHWLEWVQARQKT
jgi:hypothetical protein